MTFLKDYFIDQRIRSEKEDPAKLISKFIAKAEELLSKMIALVEKELAKLDLSKEYNTSTLIRTISKKAKVDQTIRRLFKSFSLELSKIRINYYYDLRQKTATDYQKIAPFIKIKGLRLRPIAETKAIPSATYGLPLSKRLEIQKQKALQRSQEIIAKSATMPKGAIGDFRTQYRDELKGMNNRILQRIEGLTRDVTQSVQAHFQEIWLSQLL